jgi:tRNA A58 N-methylase Trm61
MDLLNIILLIFAFLLLIILWFVWPPDSPWSPWWRTTAKKALDAARLAKINSKDIVYELGSGDAAFLITTAKKTGVKCVGIEIDYIRHLTAWLKVKLYNLEDKITLKRGNFFEHNISEATVIFVYLVPRVLEKLKPKLFSELKKGTKIISYKYKFEQCPGLKFVCSDLKNQIHLYQIL